MKSWSIMALKAIQRRLAFLARRALRLQEQEARGYWRKTAPLAKVRRAHNEWGAAFVPPPKPRSARMITDMDARRRRLEEAWARAE